MKLAKLYKGKVCFTGYPTDKSTAIFNILSRVKTPLGDLFKMVEEFEKTTGTLKQDNPFFLKESSFERIRSSVI